MFVVAVLTLPSLCFKASRLLVVFSTRDEFKWAFSRGVSPETLWRRGFSATCCACRSVSFAWKIARDSLIVNKVYVARKRNMLQDVALHDVIGGHQAYIHRKIDSGAVAREARLRSTMGK